MAATLSFGGSEPKYQILEREDELEAARLSGSSTQLNFDAAEPQSPSKSFRQATPNFYQRAFYVLLGLYGLTLLLWVLVTIPKPTESTTTTSSTTTSYESEQVKIQAMVPDFPHTVPVEFTPSARFETPQDVQSMRVNDSWATLIPNGRGFVSMPDGETYSISLFHQLHCLGMLSKALTAFLGDSIDQKGKYDQPEHLFHCIDYIRQGVMCAGDITLESTRTLGETEEERKMKAKASGWGVEHMCRDWDAIWAFAEGMRGVNSTGSE